MITKGIKRLILILSIASVVLGLIDTGIDKIRLPHKETEQVVSELPVQEFSETDEELDFGLIGENVTDTISYSSDYATTEPIVPEGEKYVVINNNLPFLDPQDGLNEFETYSELDNLGRCGVAYANISPNTLPTEERGEIGMIKPSGWHTYNFNGVVEGNYLYNRCHLIAFCLAGENANPLNLITGTRQFNVEGMLPFEEQVVQYVERTQNHCLYRVTPLFLENNLVASGVYIEALSVEDNGDGICFNVYVKNIQDGVIIDYHSGEATLK